MEVILIKDIENLGYANDIVNVKPCLLYTSRCV